jgi:hypothetical protein
MARLPLPDFPKGRQYAVSNCKLFNAEATRIRRGWEVRSNPNGSRPPWDSANGYLKRETYRLVQHLVCIQRVAVTRRSLTTLAKYPDSPVYSKTFLIGDCGRSADRMKAS